MKVCAISTGKVYFQDEHPAGLQILRSGATSETADATKEFYRDLRPKFNQRRLRNDYYQQQS